jgi:Alr-MurF fusion protein
MQAYSIAEISSIAHGRVSGDAGLQITHIITDSRKILDPLSSLFFALPGDRRDGHYYIHEAIQRGVRCFVVNRIPPGIETKSAGFVVVNDTREALQKLAAHHRSRFTYPVIGLTGSNGKTIVKEWINHLLHEEMQIVRSPKSYNSQIGVPLSLWQMHERADLAIIEAGISTTGEMEKLEKMIRPDIGVFTNIGEAHSEGFSSRLEKIREKLQLFKASKVLVYCSDYEDLDIEARSFCEHHRIGMFSWGRTHGPAVHVAETRAEGNTTFIRLRYKEKDFVFTIPFTGAAPVENAITCAVLMIWLGRTEKLDERMQGLPSLSMRLEMKNGINRCTVINDSYSNDLSSLKLALDFLQQQQQHQKKTVILSDIPQSKIPQDVLYKEVVGLLKHHRISSFKGIGPVISSYAEAFRAEGIDAEFWPDTERFIYHFNPLMFRDETILVKGARSFGFEQINQLLEIKMHQTVLTVNLNSISENLTLYRRVLGVGTRIMVMVKAFSYGSGGHEIASLLQFHKVDHLAVAYTDEGVELRKAGISIPIMVMNPELSSFPSIVNYDLQPEIYSFEILEKFSKYIENEAITEYPVHIKFDTGMHRLGFEPGDTQKLGAALLSANTLRVVSVFTHLVSSEDPDDDEYTRQQGSIFIGICEQLRAAVGYYFDRHISNTAAILRHPDLQLDMVRLGIGLYGVDVTGGNQLKLREAAVLTTTIAQIRKVEAGETVGYNRKGRVNRDSLIATIRIGYADGYPRSLSNGRGMVMIRNKFFPVIGSVCMDMTMIDITDLPGITTDDEVVVFGRGLTLNQLADWAGTIPYDIMTGISQRVKRVYIED